MRRRKEHLTVVTTIRVQDEQELETITSNGAEPVDGVEHFESDAGVGLTVANMDQNPELARKWLEEMDQARNWMDETNPLPVRGIFTDVVQLFTTYRVDIQFSFKVLGGIPKNPDIIRGWLKAKAGLKDGDEVKRMVAKTLQQMGLEIGDQPTMQQLDVAFDKIKDVRSGNGFKRTAESGRYIEGRQVKAMLRESTNTLYASKRWGPTNKGPKGFLAEHVFVVEDRLFFNRMEPDGFEFVVGHISGPQGPQSTLGEYEFMLQPTLRLHVLSDDDNVVNEDVWFSILEKGQQLGLGASRSMGFGRFIVTDFAKLPKRPKKTFEVRTLKKSELDEGETTV